MTDRVTVGESPTVTSVTLFYCFIDFLEIFMTLKQWLNDCFSGKVEIDVFQFALASFNEHEVIKALETIEKDEVVYARFKELSADKNMRNKLLFFLCVGKFIGAI